MSADLRKMIRAGLSPAEMVGRAGEVAELLKTLSHPARLMIVCTLVEGSTRWVNWKRRWMCISLICHSI